MNKAAVDAALPWIAAGVMLGLPIGYALGVVNDWMSHWLRLKRARIAMSDVLMESKVQVEVDSERGEGLSLDGGPRHGERRRSSVLGEDRRVGKRRAGAVAILLLWFVASAAVAAAYALWMNGFRLT